MAKKRKAEQDTTPTKRAKLDVNGAHNGLPKEGQKTPVKQIEDFDKEFHGNDVPLTDNSTVHLNATDDNNIDKISPLIPPQILMEDVPLTEIARDTVLRTRKECADIIHGRDDRLVVIVGPCSIHDVASALEYAAGLAAFAKEVQDDLLLIMRVYFEKPRTTVGWKGLINDPLLNGSFQINKGLRIARQLLSDINEMGMPCGVEFLDTISPQFIGDLVSWGAIGARTTESQIHRELSSGLSCPVGFKNGTGGSVPIAADALKAASAPHRFLSVTKHGLAAIVHTKGNPNTHVILRGGSDGPNFSAEHVERTVNILTKKKVSTNLMIDCSHGNSQKIHMNQIKVAADLAEQITGGQRCITGVMIESHLQEGRQDMPEKGPKYLVYGKSITDACLSWDQTVPILQKLAEAVRERRNT